VQASALKRNFVDMLSALRRPVAEAFLFLPLWVEHSTA
jgi:hypothetical protein